MKEIQAQYYQFHLPPDKGSRPRPRATSSSQCLHSISRRRRCSSSTSIAGRSGRSSPLLVPQSRESHGCIAVDNKVHQKDSQHILVGSALRRPHASAYSPMDYQTMPDIGKSLQRPFRSQSSCTVYAYSNRPVSACKLPMKHGKHTRSSLLRAQSVSCTSLMKMSSSESSEGSRPSSANERLCKIRDDYRFFKAGDPTKQVPPHGESLHSFLTGARYNNTRYLDSRTLSKLGMYIPKAGLHSFFVQEEQPNKPMQEDSDGDSQSDDSIPDNLTSVCSKELNKIPEQDETRNEQYTKAVNTDPHYLSITRWHSAEWKTNRKPVAERAPRAHTAPSRIKAIKSFYYDYDTGKKYNS